MPFVRAESTTFHRGVGTLPAMARPKVYDEPRVSTAVRFPSALHDRLRREAESRQVSVNFLVERAVADFLDRLPAVDDVIGINR